MCWREKICDTYRKIIFIAKASIHTSKATFSDQVELLVLFLKVSYTNTNTNTDIGITEKHIMII